MTRSVTPHLRPTSRSKHDPRNNLADARRSGSHAALSAASALTVDAPARGHTPRVARLHSGHRLVDAGGNRRVGYLTLKRSLDVAGAAALILLFAPIMAATFVVLCVTTRGRPLFFQDRVGQCGRLFRMCKFRTMALNADAMQHLVANEQAGPIFKNRRDPRVTRVGQFLRRSSIDEMPQLFNVLFGQMSLVGPRPPVPKEVVQYAPWQLRRLSVKPGLTCLWQVSGRSELGFDDWMLMDVWYVEHQGFWTDARLLVKTPWSVLTCRGAY